MLKFYFFFVSEEVLTLKRNIAGIWILRSNLSKLYCLELHYLVDLQFSIFQEKFKSIFFQKIFFVTNKVKVIKRFGNIFKFEFAQDSFS